MEENFWDYVDYAAVELHQWIHSDIAVGIAAVAKRATNSVYGSHA